MPHAVLNNRDRSAHAERLEFCAFCLDRAPQQKKDVFTSD